MSAKFDAYHKWLGIPPEDQPPHHYRLLGIKPLESDPDVIESAADQRMVHLRTFQAGKYGELSQKLLNEVSAARLCLLNQASKATYDVQLRGKVDAGHPAAKQPSLPKARPIPAQPAPVATATVLPQINIAPAPLRPAGQPAKKQGLPVWVVASAVAGGGCAALLIVVLIAMSLNSPIQSASVPKKSPPAAAPAPKLPEEIPSDNAAVPARASAPETVAAEPPTAPPKPAPVEEPPPAIPPEQVIPASTEPGSSLPPASPQVAGPAPEPPPPSELPPIPPAVGLTTELLPSLVTTQAAVQGKWFFDGQAIFVTGTGTHNVLELPVTPPAEYDLHLLVRRGASGAVGVVLPVGKSAVLLGIDHNHPQGGYITGISLVDGQWSHQSSPQAGPELLPLGKDIPLTVRVRRGRIRVERDTQALFDWTGDFDRCSLPSEIKVRSPRRLHVYAEQASAWFSRVAITSITDSAGGSPSPESAGAVGGRTPEPTAASQAVVREQLASLFGSPGKRTPAEKLQTAAELSDLAAGAKNPTERYVLLRESQRWATEAVRPRLALEVTDRLTAEFDIDAAGEQVKVIGTLAGAAKDDASVALVLEESLPAIQRAVAAGQFDAAQRILDALGRLALRPSGRRYQPQIAELRSAAAAGSRLARKLESAREKLLSDPANADAHLVVGASLCFSSGDWAAGLPHLAKGGDAGLQAAAQKELAGAKTPEEEAAIGDAWWNAADMSAKEFRSAAITRAVVWYRRARPGVTSGLAQAKIDKRLADAGPLALSAADATGGKPAATQAGKGVLLVMHVGEEQTRAPEFCRKVSLPFELATNFDRNRTDYSKFHTIVAGSNAMDYFGQDNTRQPEAFQHLDQFVAEGGHLVLFGVFDGRNCENLARFGIYTEARHAETFQPAGPATDLLLQGLEKLVPQDGKMKSCGAIQCAVPHEVLLRIGPGRREGETAMISLPYKAGRVTFTECEPHAAGDWWLMEAVVAWIARGSPLPN